MHYIEKHVLFCSLPVPVLDAGAGGQAIPLWRPVGRRRHGWPVSVCLSPSVCPIYLCVYQPIFNLSVYLSIFIYLSIYPSIYLSTSLSINQSINLSIYLSIYLSIKPNLT